MLRRRLIVMLLLATGTPGLAKSRRPVAKEHVSSASFSLGLTQMQGARLKPITQASFSAGYEATPSLQLGISQSLTKNYLINQDGDEFAVNDTVLSLAVMPGNSKDAMNFYGSMSTTLPVSERSRRNEIRTISSLSTGVDYTAWQMLTLGAGLGASYYFSKYDTEPIGEEGRGAALPQYDVYAEQNTRLSFLKAGFLGYSFTFSETYYYKIEEEASNSSDRNISDQAYQLKVFTGYGFSFLTISMGYLQGTLIELPGIKEFVLFDEERTIGYLSVGMKF